MAPSILKDTQKTLSKGVNKKQATKLAKTTGKTVSKGVKGAAVTKAVKGAVAKTSDRTRNGVFLAVGAASAGAAFLLVRRRRHGTETEGGTDLNDPALARKVESEIFRPADAPKSTVSVNVEHGVVFLRGTVRDPAQAESLERSARAVDGVKDVQNLLHEPGKPAPAKSESHDSVERPAP
jgi:osmotically-inducible protein OsmY